MACGYSPLLIAADLTLEWVLAWLRLLDELDDWLR